MLGNSDYIQYELYSKERGTISIPEPINFEEGNRDIIERESKRKSFDIKKAGAIELFDSAYFYLLGIFEIYGINPDVRLIEKRKDNMRVDERWRVVSEVALDLGSLDFDMERKTAKVETSLGGMLQVLDSRFDDDYDILPNESADGDVLQELKTVDVNHESRKILRRSRLFVEDGTRVGIIVSGNDGTNARSIPFQFDYNSDQENVSNVIGDKLSAVSGDYTTLSLDKVANLFYTNSDRARRVRLTGKVKIVVTEGDFGSISLDLLRYNYQNPETLFAGKIEELQIIGISGPTSINPGDVLEYTFNDYIIDLEKGDGLAIGTFSITDDGMAYEVFETELLITEDSWYRDTSSKAIKPFDLFERLVAKATGFEGAFMSSIFDVGGKYENILVTHGTWLRNMPAILNEGKDDERELQMTTSLKNAFEAFEILEPLMWGVKKVGNKEYFFIETEKESQRNFNSIKLGETRGAFQLINVQEEKRKAIPDNFYSSINIGSTKSGSEYGEVNNLYSICGNAKWNTVNKRNKSEYKATTEWRTGSEDVELARVLQYSENPDKDSPYDDEFFLLDCKKEGVVYALKKWQDYYVSKPYNVYDADSNYNWNMTPVNLLKGHGWKLNAGLIQRPLEAIKFISSNCNKSVVTDDGSEKRDIVHNTLDKPTFRNMSIEFKLQVNPEIAEMLTGSTNGIDNKYGLVQFSSKGDIQYGRLIKVDQNNEGSFKLIEAVI